MEGRAAHDGGRPAGDRIPEPALRGVFITGTDTGVGKTLAACAWIHAARRAGLRCGAMKPVAAGATPQSGTLLNEDTDAMLRALDWPRERAGWITPVVLREPIAPHIAAQLERRVIDRAVILDAYARMSDAHEYVVVEGVGGFCVPLDEHHDTTDLARDIGLPVVMVVGMKLGCLNHAMLTAQAVRHAGLRLTGWIANSATPDMPYRDDNIETLARRLSAPLIGTIPYLASGDAERASHELRIELAT